MRSGATRRRRYAGSAAASAKSPGRSSTAASGSARSWWADCCVGLGYSCQANRKTREGTNHPDRDAQFAHINTVVQAAIAAGEPAISVDTKKKELVGDFKNPGRELRPKAGPEPVRVHDFELPGLGKVAPYGVYDLAANAGWVSVGVDADTAAFAVESIRRWWCKLGKARDPEGSVRTRASQCRLKWDEANPGSCGLQDSQHGHTPPEVEQSAAIGGNMLMVAGAEAEEVAQFIVSPAEPGC